MASTSTESPSVDRASGIGGSDIAKIIGVSPHGGPFAVYCDKLGLADPVEQTERMKMGKLLEPVVVQLYEERHSMQVLWFDQTIRHEKEAIVIGTPDGFVGEKYAAHSPGAQLGFEAKTAGLDQAWRWGDEGDNVPQEYLVQCQWYMLLTGAPVWDLAVLIAGDRYKDFPLHADPSLQGMMLDQARKFWRDHIEKRDPPPIDASTAAKSYLRRKYPHAAEDARPATLKERELLATVVRAKAELKTLTEYTTIAENQLKDAIGNAAGVYDEESRTRATWTEVAEGIVPSFTRKAYRRLSVRAAKED